MKRENGSEREKSQQKNRQQAPEKKRSQNCQSLHLVPHATSHAPANPLDALIRPCFRGANGLIANNVTSRAIGPPHARGLAHLKLIVNTANMDDGLQKQQNEATKVARISMKISASTGLNTMIWSREIPVSWLQSFEIKTGCIADQPGTRLTGCQLATAVFENRLV